MAKITPLKDSKTNGKATGGKVAANDSSKNGSSGKGGTSVAVPSPRAALPQERFVPKFSAEERSQLQETLQTSLYDLVHLQLVTKQAHWNVVGPTFHPTHLFLDEIYEYVQESTDEVAERLVTLGMSPNGQGPEVVANTRVAPIAAGFHRDLEAIELMAERLTTTSGDLREELEPIEDVDTVTADLLHGIIEGLEKYLWMLRAHLI